MRKKCRRRYGLRVSMPFREGIDDEASAFMCPATKTKRAPNYMSWSIHKVCSSKTGDPFFFHSSFFFLSYIYRWIEKSELLRGCPTKKKKSEDIVESSFTPIKLYHALNEHTRKMTVVLYSCDCDDAPEKFTEDGGNVAPFAPFPFLSFPPFPFPFPLLSCFFPFLSILYPPRTKINNDKKPSNKSAP